MNDPRSKEKPLFPQGLYGITAEKFSLGRSNPEVAQAMIDGGVKIIQYREKRPQKNFRRILDECRAIRALTRAAGVLFIVNDYVDIALLAEADGVHVGQDDLPVPEVRRLIGPHKLIGLSTHSPEQAREAHEMGADYIGVGPLFSTRTKEDVCDPVGLTYLEYAVQQVRLPFVAIGGIKLHNIDEVIRRGVKTICLVTEIVGAEDISGMVRELNAVMHSAQVVL